MRTLITSAIMVLSSISLVLLTVNVALALHPDTHEKLNENITLKQYPGCYPLDDYLKQNLHLKDGVQCIMNGDKIWRWVRLGGSKEDTEVIPILRAFNHFHDPLVSNWYWAGFGHTGVFKSSAVWFMEPYQEVVFGSYSWPDARRYYYGALTAPYDTTRDSYYALCFRSLGQCMHLVQDASVPSHVRNDGHVLYHYEYWVKDNMAEIDAYLRNSVFPVTPHLVNAPITDIIDADIYNGTNPEITLTGSIGISEYTNANFFSEDTISSDHYPYPSLKTSAIPVDNYLADPRDPSKQILRKYFFKTGDGDNGYPLAAMNYAEHYRRKKLAWLDIPSYTNYAGALDKLCFAEYARRLLPRAVAYSSELLRYFFRGDIEAVDAATTHDADGAITGMTMKVKNATPDEGMAYGDLVVSCRYLPDGETDYIGTKSAEVTLSSLATGATSDGEYTFTFDAPIPVDSTDKQYMLVYRGQLGAEADAVAAKAFKADVVVIDDWEDGQEWTTEDTRATLSLDGTNHYQGDGALKVEVASDYFIDLVYEKLLEPSGNVRFTIGGVHVYNNIPPPSNPCSYSWTEKAVQHISLDKDAKLSSVTVKAQQTAYYHTSPLTYGTITMDIYSEDDTLLGSITKSISEFPLWSNNNLDEVELILDEPTEVPANFKLVFHSDDYTTNSIGHLYKFGFQRCFYP